MPDAPVPDRRIGEADWYGRRLNGSGGVGDRVVSAGYPAYARILGSDCPPYGQCCLQEAGSTLAGL